MTFDISPLSYLFYPCNGRRRYILIAMHGRGGSMHDFESLEEEWQIPGLCYLYLNGPDPFYSGRSWYDLPPNPLPGILRSRNLLAMVIEQLDKVGFPPSRCFLLGFSQGSLMTFEFGARYPQLLAGYIGISGHVYDVDRLAEEAIPRIRSQGHWLATHGTHDNMLSIEIARAQMTHLKKNGFPMEFREYDKGHTFDFKEEMLYIGQWIKHRCR